MASASSTEGAETVDDLTKPPFLRRVRIRGYKSIAFCDVTLEPLTILVGRNASGKSNFLDALAFLRDVMDTSAPTAVNRRGGWTSVVSRTSLAQKIEIEITAGFTCGRPYLWTDGNGAGGSRPPDGAINPDLKGVTLAAVYSLEFSRGPHSSASISRERLEITDMRNQRVGGFEISNGIFNRRWWQPESSEPLPLPRYRDLLEAMARDGKSVTRPDQPLLGLIGVQPFIDLGDGLRSMGFYNFQPDAIRALQKPNGDSPMEKDGRNLASVIEGLKELDPDWVLRVQRYLSAVTEQVESFDAARYGEYETIRFRLHSHGGGGAPLEFDAAAMSDWSAPQKVVQVL